MRRRRTNRRETARNMKIKWGVLIAIIFAFAGVSYAAHTNVLYGDFSSGTGNMSFIFDDGEDVHVEMTCGSKGDTTDLGGKASYKDKNLLISDIGPIDMSDFIDGNVNITISYAIKAEDDETGIRLPAEVKEDAKNGYDLGTVRFERLSDTPVWTLENGDNSWGTKTENIGGTPDAVDRLLPRILGEFQVYNQIYPHYEDGLIEGTILLKQKGEFALQGDSKIELSSLELPNDVTDEVQNVSTLEVEGTYGFTIPLKLDQFNNDINEN